MSKKNISTSRDLFGLNYSQQYFKNLKDLVEAHKSRSASLLYRKKLKEHQDKVNYTNEIQRIRGELSRNDTRLPIGNTRYIRKKDSKVERVRRRSIDKIK